MKIWTAVIAALLIASIRFAFAVFGDGSGSVSYLPFLETAIFVVSIFVFIKMTPLTGHVRKYITWSVVFLVLVIIFIAIIDFIYKNDAFNSSEWMLDFAVLVADFVAGIMFGFTFRVTSNVFRRKINR